MLGMIIGYRIGYVGIGLQLEWACWGLLQSYLSYRNRFCFAVKWNQVGLLKSMSSYSVKSKNCSINCRTQLFC